MLEVDVDAPITYEVVAGGTAKGKDILLDSIGYAYNIKATWANSRNWWCSVRNKNMRCAATVIEKGGTFARGAHNHIHAADLGKKHNVKITRKVKDEAASKLYQPAKMIVEDQMRTELTDKDFAIPDEADVGGEAHETAEEVNEIDAGDDLLCLGQVCGG